jgi:hypothetical protein
MNTFEPRKPQVDRDVRALRNDELDAVSGGFFAFHATTDAIDAIAKALAASAQKQ